MGREAPAKGRSIMGERRATYNRRKIGQEVSLQQQQMRQGQTRQEYFDEPWKKHSAKQPGRRMQRRLEKRQQKRHRGVLLIIAVLLLLVAAYFGSKIFVAMEKWQGKAEKSDFSVSAQTPEKIEDEVINVAIFGTDEDGFRTDVNIIASFHTATQQLHLLSVPRDTRVTMTQEMTRFLEEKGRTVPERNGVYGQCKLTEVHAYAGEGNRCAFSVAILEEILGIKIDYYVKVNISAFRQIVDAVGGVDFDVASRLYYVDPVQNLYIDLYPGMQHLDGNRAEQLVRYRDGYAQKDLKRIEVQQQFIQALIEKICNSETLMENLDDLLKVALDCTESDITWKEALKYMKYAKSFRPENMTTDTIPGEGGAYFDMDEEGTKALVDWRIYGIEPPPAEQNTEERPTTEEGTITNG